MNIYVYDRFSYGYNCVIFCQVGRYKRSQAGRKETGKRKTKF